VLLPIYQATSLRATCVSDQELVVFISQKCFFWSQEVAPFYHFVHMIHTNKGKAIWDAAPCSLADDDSNILLEPGYVSLYIIQNNTFLSENIKGFFWGGGHANSEGEQ
jgi:hypothetical protein